MVSTLKALQESLEERLADVIAIQGQINRIIGIARVPDLLLEMDITPTDPESDKLDLIEFRQAELRDGQIGCLTDGWDDPDDG